MEGRFLRLHLLFSTEPSSYLSPTELHEGGRPGDAASQKLQQEGAGARIKVRQYDSQLSSSDAIGARFQ
jgi:hypothetical protein